MENDNINKEEERILERFFAESKTDLPDDGFTRRVMDSLPQKARRRNCVWTMVCGLAAAAFFLLSDGAYSVRVFVTNAAQALTSSLSAVQCSKHAGRSGCSACVSVFRHRKRH